MKRSLLLLPIFLTALLVLPLPAGAFPSQPDSIRGDWFSRVHNIREATVTARSIKDIGVQQTSFDSVALKESIALSMADVLTFHSPIFVKNYGRATLSTVAFRGTSPSHTQVSWNGMRINSPMLGMTDFSTIPSFFIDDASLLHGTSSVTETGGGLGGAVKLATKPAAAKGLGMQYVQGAGSFRTFDEYLRLTYGDARWQVSTRAVLSTSPNDFRYRNHDKKLNRYDEDMNIVEQYYPIERNRSGAYRDGHLLQEAYYSPGNGNRLGLNLWYSDFNRELPMLTTDYGEDTDFDNRQRERTVRGIVSWDRWRSDSKFTLKGGCIHTWLAYDYSRDLGNGVMAVMTRSRSRVNTLYGQAEGEYYLGGKWLFSANLAVYQHFVLSQDKHVILQEGGQAIVGYDKGRTEVSGSASVRWRPTERLGLSAVLREEIYGNDRAPLIPALFADVLLVRKCHLTAKASVSRNFRFPTLNDLYFLPGGNPDLHRESGWTCDAGLSLSTGMADRLRFSGSVNGFDSHIDDWIIWLPTVKGFFSPRNLKKVHAYGIECKADLATKPVHGIGMDLDGTFAWTPSVNIGDPLSPADRSVMRQLPYVPKYSASLTGRLSWRAWGLMYKWCYYSERYTMSSNDDSLTGHLPPYFMNNVSLDRNLSLPRIDLSLKLAVNNLFNEEYLSVLSRPMPGIHFEFFIGITPKFPTH